MTASFIEALAAVHPISVVVLALVTLQRLAELALARRNTRALLAGGAAEIAPDLQPRLLAGVPQDGHHQHRIADNA